MDTLLQDLRYAVRTLRQSKGFTVLAVLCLALGIGVNATLFSVVNASVIHPLPWKEPDRLAMLKEDRPRADIHRADPSWATWRAMRAESRAFSALAAWDNRSFTVTDGDDPLRVSGTLASADLVPMLGVAPALGRTFRADEDTTGAPAVVLLSWDLWRNRFGGDPRIVGRTIRVNDVPRTVVGVMPDRFNFPARAQLWVPIAPAYAAADPTRFDDRGLAVIGRLAPGVSLAAASGEVAAIERRLASAHPDAFLGWQAHADPILEDFVERDTRQIIWTMFGAVTFVLLIACANVANLMLARASARQREIAVRAALGAARWRIVRQLLVESVLIALAAGVLGVLLTFWGLDLIDAAIPPEDALPSFIHWSVDRATLAYTLVVAVGTGILFGLAPALGAARTNLQEGLKEGSRGSGAGVQRGRLRAALVVAEVGLSLVLLVGASLFVRSFLNLQRSSGGFDTAPIMTMRFFMPAARYPDDSARRQRVADILRRVEAVPGVEAAGASNLIPLENGGNIGEVAIEGRDLPRETAPRLFWAGVTPHFFRTIGVPILRGRDFTEADAEADAEARAPVAVVDERMAQRLFAGADPLGRRFRLLRDTAAGWFTVVGVVRQFRWDQLDDHMDVPGAYLAYAWDATPNTGLVVRARAGDPARLTRALRDAIHASDPALAVFNEATMEHVRRTGFWQYGLFSWMFGIFGAIALALATIGVYGVIAFGVQQRTHEIGVRVALGARRRDVLRLVVGQGVRLAGVGVLVGVLGALAVTRVVRGILVGVGATDPVSFLGVALFLTAVAAAASFIPARRASAVDPLSALRAD